MHDALAHFGGGCIRRTEGAIAYGNEHASGSIWATAVNRHACARFPDTCSKAVRRKAKGSRLLQSCGVIREQPSVPVTNVSMRRVSEIDIPVVVIERGPLVLDQGIEGQFSPGAASAGSRYRRGDESRAVCLLRAGDEVDGVQARVIDAIQGAGCHQIHRVGRKVDRRCTGYAVLSDVRRVIVLPWDRSLSGRGAVRRSQQIDVPDRLSIRAAIGIRIEGVHRIVRCCDKQHIVHQAVAHRQPGNIKGLGIGQSIHRQGKQLPECVYIHISGSEERLLAIRPGVRQIVAPSRHGHGCWCLCEQVCPGHAERAYREQPERKKAQGRLHHGGNQRLGGRTARAERFTHTRKHLPKA